MSPPCFLSSPPPLLRPILSRFGPPTLLSLPLHFPQNPHDHNSLATLQQFVGYIDVIDIREIQKVIDLITSYVPQINDLEDAHVLILIPKCLELVRISNEVDKPVEFVNSVVDALIKCEWSKVLLIKMVEIVRDFSSCIDKLRRREFLEKIFVKMRNDVEMQDLPGLVYQLLVLATKGFGKREDPSLGQEVLGLVRLDSRAFNHFTVAVLLSVARIRRFSETALGVLKSALFNAYKDYKFAKVCRWISAELSEEYLENARVIEKAILNAVNASHCGREHIVPSIVQLGFGLLEGVEEGIQKEISKSDGLMGMEELGMQVLKCLFEVHDMSRNQIIEQCKFRVLSLKPEQCFPITRLLGYLVLVHPRSMLDHVSHLKEMLDYFAFMDDRISPHLVTILLPLIKFKCDLQDYTILVLRKAMFRRENAVRLAAISAIFDLILAEKQSKTDGLFSFQESSSQASCSQHAEVSQPTRPDLFQELGGLLQRCLYQQANVRQNLYHGLMKLVLVDPLTASTILDFLLPHFKRFYREDADIQLGIDQCVKLENGRTFSGESFSNALAQIRKFLRNGNLEGLLGKDQDPGSRQMEEEKRRYSATLLLGIVEGTGTKRATLRASVSDTADKLVLGSTKLPPERTPLLATSSIHRLLQLALELGKLDPKNGAPSQINSQHSSGMMQVLNSKVLPCILHMCFRQLKFFSFTGKDDPIKTLIYGEIKLLGPPILNVILYLKPVAKPGTDLSKKKEREGKMLNGLEDVSTGVMDAGRDGDCQLAEGIDDQSTRSKELLIKTIIKPLFMEFLEFSFFREAEILCDIVLMIGNKLPEERRNLVGSWVTRICKSSHVSNSKVAKSLVLAAVTLSSPPADLDVAQNMAAELLRVVGSEDTDPLDISETFPVINKLTDAAIVSTILQKVFLFNQMRKVAPELAMEEMLYSRAEAVVKVLSYIVAMNLKDPQAEHLLRLAAKFYKNLARISKYRIAPKGCKQVLPSLKYQRLVEITCRQLTTPVYNFVAHMQKNQQESNKPRGIVNKIKRENKCIPDLIFQIEDYEKYLIQLSKTTKVNLLRHAKRSTSRDFKILEPREDTLEEQNPTEEADSDNLNATENKSSEESGDEGEETDSGQLPKSGSPMAAEDTEDEGEAALPKVKRAKMKRVVQESSDEE
ncbi:UNVERIFIED_CONTAM: Fanconi anemia group I protein [Sesamum angustifolium]|uniref:Fanconi anemia group I protein n=1 Tax=Sesamum angustifolium TaxID=2727405 RepID=A0AAW2P0P2_9LAMI